MTSRASQENLNEQKSLTKDLQTFFGKLFEVISAKQLLKVSVLRT